MALEVPAGPVMHPAPVGRIGMIGAVWGVIAGVVDVVLFVVLRLLGAPMQVQAPGATTLTQINVVAVFVACIAAGVVGALLACLVRSVAAGPAIVMVAGTAVALLSLFLPLLQPAEVPWSTRLGVAALHLVAAVILVPALSRGTTSEDPPAGSLPHRV